MSTISTFVLKREDDVTSAAKIGRDFFLGGTVNAPLDNVDFFYLVLGGSVEMILILLTYYVQ